MIRWKRSTGDFVKSHDGRWNIDPLYCGRTRPELYNLLCDGKVVGSYYSTQREAKKDAERIADSHENVKASSR